MHCGNYLPKQLFLHSVELVLRYRRCNVFHFRTSPCKYYNGIMFLTSCLTVDTTGHSVLVFEIESYLDYCPFKEVRNLAKFRICTIFKQVSYQLELQG